MAEPGIETVTEVVDTPVEKTSRMQSFTINHPRTAKAVGIVAITAATLGAVAMWKNRKQMLDTIEGDTSDDSETDSSEIA